MEENETEQTEQTQEVQTGEAQEGQTGEAQDVQTGEAEETQQTEKIEQTKEPKEPESKQSFIDRWKDKLTGRSADEEPQGDDIPDEFTEAARKMNWSDEDTAAFAADYTDKQLKEMIPSLLGEDTVKTDDTSDKTPVEQESETKPDADTNSQEDERLKPLLDRIAALEAERDSGKEKSAAEEKTEFVRRASDLFDKTSEEFEVFGKTDDLPKFPDGRYISTSPQMRARLEVYGMAEQLKEAGMPGDKALEFSLNAYKGAHLTVETKRNVIKDLKKREQTLGGKRVSHEVATTGDLTGPQILQAVARKHGRELPM